MGIPVADLFAGLYGCIGMLAALNHRNATGQGQRIDIGMLDTHVAWLANQGMNYLATGENPPRLGNQHPNIAPYQEFPTKDGYIILAVGNDPTFERFCKNFGQEHLLADERFATNAKRVENRDLVTETLTPVMRSKTTAEWIDALEALKIGCGPINTLEQVFADPQVKARGCVVEMPHASGADGEGHRQPGAPLRHAGRLPRRAAGARRSTRRRCWAGCSAWARRRSRRCGRRGSPDAAGGATPAARRRAAAPR